MNIIVKYLHFDENLPFEKFSYLLNYVSLKRQQKISAFIKNQSKLQSLFSELLVRSQIADTLKINHRDIKFLYNPYNKPYLKDHPQYFFSVSHSDNFIFFVSYTSDIGIDCEKVKHFNDKISNRFFTLDEQNYIHSHKDKDKNFASYEIWTKKEAYLKFTGAGLSTPLSSFSVLDHHLNPHFLSFSFSEFVISIFSNDILNNNISPILDEVTVADLLKYFH